MDLTIKKDSNITQFNPEQTKQKISQAEAAIEYGEKTGNIEIVENAIDALCDERYQFLMWWGGQEKPVGGRGKTSNRTVRGLLEEYGRTEMEISRWRKKYGSAEQTELTKEKLKEVSRRIIDGTTSVQGNKSENDEWYTPPQYIEAARKVMGDIDLDPASNELAQSIINAAEYFTEGALEKDWHGRVWLNPPFSKVLPFANKLISHMESGDVSQAIVLTNNNTDTLWWHKLAELSTLICFTRGRISFYNHAGEAKGNTNGQTFFYFGENPEKFTAEFYPHGLVLK